MHWRPPVSPALCTEQVRSSGITGQIIFGWVVCPGIKAKTGDVVVHYGLKLGEPGFGEAELSTQKRVGDLHAMLISELQYSVVLFCLPGCGGGYRNCPSGLLKREIHLPGFHAHSAFSLFRGEPGLLKRVVQLLPRELWGVLIVCESRFELADLKSFSSLDNLRAVPQGKRERCFEINLSGNWFR